MEQTLISADYVAAIRNGDSTLLRQMYLHIFPIVRNLILKNSGTEDDAKDVFQDAVMIIYEKAGCPDFQLTSQFSTYFYAVCKYRWFNRLQKKSSSEVTIPEEAKYIADELPDLDFEELERRKLFDKAIAALGQDCQKLLRLFFQKIPMEEIAGQMNYGSEGYARRRKHLCKERLIELIKSYPEYRDLRNA